MLIGYVSDERYVAVPRALLEFRGESGITEAQSAASGAVYADIEPGDYEVIIACDGFGSKISRVSVSPDRPHHFRLLSNSLSGYMWPKWVKGGEKAEFRVHATEAYKLSLWRYGWEKEFILNRGWFDEHGPQATRQITPDGDYTQTGVQWNKEGYTNPHHLQYITAPERSGLYYLHAKGESGAFFSFPWIVAPRQPTSPIAVLASNMSWNAYNNFGGRSNYINLIELPDAPTINARQELPRYIDKDHAFYNTEDYAPLSFDRPEPINFIPEDEQITDPIEGRSACHIAPTEWRFFGWLEREGIDYDLYGETQFHFDDFNLDDYKILIITTHPEYWSIEMYDKLKAWVFERGGKLMYLGGNGVNCKVEFVDDATMIVRNGIKADFDKRGCESRLHGYHESEANLLGVVFTDAGIMTSAPYKVVDDDHWLWEGTGLHNGDIFGRESLHQRCPGGASGHETDKVSPSSPANVRVLAKGMNPDDGGADMVHFDTPSGGEVFSVGSITYTASIPIDENVSQITSNVIRRFLG